MGEPDEKNSPLEEPIVFTSFVSEHLGGDPIYLEASLPVLKKVRLLINTCFILSFSF